MKVKAHIMPRLQQGLLPLVTLYLFLDKECHSSDRIDIASYGNIQITTAWHDKGRCQKKTGKCGNFEKKKQGGGGLPESHFHIFTVFNMWDLPKINGKIGKKFPNRGEGGVPDLGKIPTFSRFFLATSLSMHKKMLFQGDWCPGGGRFLSPSKPYVILTFKASCYW